MSSNPIANGYITVAERSAAFHADYKTPSIENKVEHFILFPDGKGFVTVRSEVWKDAADRAKGLPPDGVGNASMPIPGPTNFTKNSELENAETSALGRALAMIGYHSKETMASGDEINAKGGKADVAKEPNENVKKIASKPAEKKDAEPLSQTQRKQIFSLRDQIGLSNKELGDIRLQQTGKHSSAQMTADDGVKLIEYLKSVDAGLTEIEQATGGERVKAA